MAAAPEPTTRPSATHPGVSARSKIDGRSRSRRIVPITVRKPTFDYAETPHNWMPRNPAFGYQLNGGSLTLPYLEPYLIRVMRKAKAELGDRFPDLQRDIDLFNGQEAHHYRLHAAYNALLRERYDGIEELEAEIKADFERMLREESLLWNLGYAAGFETTGMVIAQTFFVGARESLLDADPAVTNLWGWHLAEEYEHRCVAIEVFRAFGGGYRERVKQFLHQTRHLYGFGDRAASLMRAQDAERGLVDVEGESAEMIRERRRLEKQQTRYAQRHVARSLLPGHDPRRHRPLEPGDALLEDLDWE